MVSGVRHWRGSTVTLLTENNNIELQGDKSDMLNLRNCVPQDQSWDHYSF